MNNKLTRETIVAREIIFYWMKFRHSKRGDIHMSYLLAVYCRYNQRSPRPISVWAASCLLPIHARREFDGHGRYAHHPTSSHRAYEYTHRQEPHRLQPHFQEASIVIFNASQQYSGLYTLYYNPFYIYLDRAEDADR